MSSVKDKLSIFESSKKPPPMKPKPNRLKIDVAMKPKDVIEKETDSIQNCQKISAQNNQDANERTISDKIELVTSNIDLIIDTKRVDKLIVEVAMKPKALIDKEADSIQNCQNISTQNNQDTNERTISDKIELVTSNIDSIIDTKREDKLIVEVAMKTKAVIDKKVDFIQNCQNISTQNNQDANERTISHKIELVTSNIDSIIDTKRDDELIVEVEPKKVTNVIDECVEYSEPAVVPENDEIIPINDDGVMTDVTYNFLESVYDVPDLRLYNYEHGSKNTAVTKEAPVEIPIVEIVKENDSNSGTGNNVVTETTESVPIVDMTPSKYLIEEMYNIALWRNSDSLSDDAISNQRASVVSNKTRDSSSSSVLIGEDKGKLETHVKRKFFANPFKRSPKKAVIDNSDSESLQECHDKDKTCDKNAPTNDDNSSLDSESKKPLTSMFNRDWLNTLGVGIKKKTNVLSELKNAFSHGKFKYFAKKDNWVTTTKVNDDDIVDIFAIKNQNLKLSNFIIQSETKKSGNITKKNECKNTKITKDKAVLKDNIKSASNKALATNDSDSDSIYDDDGEDSDDVQANHNEMINGESSAKVTRSLESAAFDPSSVKIQVSDNESVYDDEEEDEQMLESSEIEGNENNVNRASDNPLSSKCGTKDRLSNEEVGEMEGSVLRQTNQRMKVTENDSKKTKSSIKDDLMKFLSNRNTENDKGKITTEIDRGDIEVYDEDPDNVEEYVSDVEDEDGLKLKKPDCDKSEKVPEKPKRFAKDNNVSKISIKDKDKNEMTNNDVYDDEGDVMEGDGRDTEGPEKEITKKDSKSKNFFNVKIQKSLQKMIANKSDCSVKSIRKQDEVDKRGNKHSKQLELYDEDCEVVEEFVSDNSIYDDEAEDDEVYDDEEENQSIVVPAVCSAKIQSKPKTKTFLSSILTKTSAKKSAKESIERTEAVNINNNKTHNDTEVYDDDDEDNQNVEDTEIYDDEDNAGIDDTNLSEKEEAKNRHELIDDQTQGRKNLIGKKKVSIASKLTADIMRRQRNIKVNLKNIVPSKGGPEKQKNCKPKVSKSEDDLVSEQVLTAVKGVEENEDEVLKKLIKKNLETAKKTFKLKEPIQTISVARAVKTIYQDSKTYMKFNIGEILDVLEYRNDLVLVKNGIGKCGLTSINNVQIIKNAP